VRRAAILGALTLLAGACHSPARPARAESSVSRIPVPSGAHAQELELGPDIDMDLEPPFPLEWKPGQVLLHGFGGAKYLSDFRVDRSGAPTIELDEDEYEVLPVVGGGAQMKLAGRGFDLGLEGYLSFAGRSDLEAFAAGGGGAVVVFDVNLFLVEAYGGVFASRFLDERVRLHAGAGPLLQWVGYDQDDGTEEEDTDGSGGGVYARAGLEFLLPSNRLVGIAVRWSEASVDLGDELGDLDLSDLELLFTYSYGSRPSRVGGW